MGGAHVGRENILRNRRMENPVERGFLLPNRYRSPGLLPWALVGERIA